jgi:hypothetical protein
MPDPQRPDLAAELLRRMAADQQARGIHHNGHTTHPDHDLMRTTDADNTTALQRTFDQHGWPGHSLVGEQAANAAWLLTMHTEPDLQLRALDLLRHAADHGDATPRQLAYLTDRCLTYQGRPQLYGTQYHDPGDGRGLRMWPVADLDARRAEVGPGPHADYDATIRASHQRPAPCDRPASTTSTSNPPGTAPAPSAP